MASLTCLVSQLQWPEQRGWPGIYFSLLVASSKEVGPLYIDPDPGSITHAAFPWSKEVTRSTQIQGKHSLVSTFRWEER